MNNTSGQKVWVTEEILNSGYDDEMSVFFGVYSSRPRALVRLVQELSAVNPEASRTDIVSRIVRNPDGSASLSYGLRLFCVQPVTVY